MQQAGSSDRVITYSGDAPMQVALPLVSDGTGATVAYGWTVNLVNTGKGDLEVVDGQGHRVVVLKGYHRRALVATDEALDGTYGGWTDAADFADPIVYNSTVENVAYTSASSDATPSVLRAKRILVGSTVTITYLDDGVLGQTVTLELAGGTNTTEVTITDASSFKLFNDTDWKMSTGEQLVMQMVSTDGWAELGRRENTQANSPSSASVCNADAGLLINAVNCASAISSIAGGKIGDVATIWSTLATGGLTHSTKLFLNNETDLVWAVDDIIQLQKISSGADGWWQVDYPGS
jgi:hypothetical protein